MASRQTDIQPRNVTTNMTSPLRITFVLASAILALTTAYSVIFDTYRNTSDPLVTSIPKSPSYWAQKSNVLNQYGVKLAWGWTSVVFWLLWLTSPRPAMISVVKWIIETISWMAFTSWFFGPAVFERFLLLSGAECLVQTPDGTHLSLPEQYCLDKSIISHTTHPHLFTSQTLLLPTDWKAIPRLRRGHDVSGHIFLLTMAVLFLSQQLKASLRFRYTWSNLHFFAVSTAVVLIATWLFAIGTTGLYFHSPSEKISGYLLGLATFAFTLPFGN